MSWLDEVGTYLAAQSLGVPIALGVEPDAPDEVITVLDSPARGMAVRVMSPRKDVNQVMDALYAIGARAILVTAIHNARL